MPEKPIDLYSTAGNTNTTELFKGRKVLVVGIPGCFTGVCTKDHVRPFIYFSMGLAYGRLGSYVR